MPTFKAVVTRNSNGSVELTPQGGGNPPRELEMGAEADITFDVVRTAAQIEEDTKAERSRRSTDITTL